jgi:hypothetical protein
VGVDLLLQHATATAAEHAGAEPLDEWQAVDRALREAPADTHPHIAATAGALLSGTPEARLSWAFQALINGIERTAVPD